MKGENQALRLEKMMQKHHLYPEYEVCLPSVSVKKSALKKLGAGDILLLGMARLEVLLLSEHTGCAKALLVNAQGGLTIQIMQYMKQLPKHIDGKKYKEVRVTLGNVQCRVLERGHKIEMAQIDTDEVRLIHATEEIAKGRLVEVDDEIAVEIKEVTAV